MLEAPVAARALLDEVQAALPSLPKLPTRTYEMSEINEALDFMARGTHVGKILIRTSAVEASAPLPPICGPAGDAMVRTLHLLRGGGAAAAAALSPSAAAAAGRCVVLRAPPALDTELSAALLGAR